MSNKIYRLTQYKEYSQSFNVNGKDVYVRFKSNKRDNGIFTTDNESLQKAIESHKNFNVLFSLEKVFGEPTIAKEQPKTESSSVEDSAKEEQAEETEKEIKVKNIQEANAQVKKLFGKDAPTFRLSEKAIEYFKSNGYKLEFDK